MATHSSLLVWRIPMDKGAWQATVYRVAKIQTRLKQLSTHTCLSSLMRTWPVKESLLYLSSPNWKQL